MATAGLLSSAEAAYAATADPGVAETAAHGVPGIPGICCQPFGNITIIDFDECSGRGDDDDEGHGRHGRHHGGCGFGPSMGGGGGGPITNQTFFDYGI